MVRILFPPAMSYVRTGLLAHTSPARPVFFVGEKAARSGAGVVRSSHLAVIVFWQHLDEAVIARALEAGDAIEAEGVEFRRRDRGARTLHKKGDTPFLTPVWMRPANHRDLNVLGWRNNTSSISRGTRWPAYSTPGGSSGACGARTGRAFAVVNYEQGVEPFLKTDRLSDTERAMLMGGACAKAYGWSPKKA